MRIAVTTDFSERSKEAFAFAATIAKKLTADLYLFHHAVRSLLTAPGQLQRLHDSLEVKLREIATQDESLKQCAPTPVLVRGGNARTFAESLTANDIDLLVLSTHGRTGVARFLMGSFAERAIRLAPCPVFVCRPRQREGDANVQTDTDLDRVLVAHDFSVQGGVAAEYGRLWSMAFRAKTRLLHVVDSECGITGFEIELFSGWHEYHQTLKERALEKLHALARDYWSGVDAEVTVAIGHPVLEILSQSEEYDAKLIVMGARGATCPDHVSLGTVAEKVSRKASCPVLIVRGEASLDTRQHEAEASP
jgi:nucleotide-binding universal stress UspA family protein